MHLFWLVFLAGVLGLSPAGAERVVAYRIVDARAIPDSLTGQPGDPDAGRALFLDEKLSRCAFCHGVPDKPADEPAAKQAAAPSLDDVGRRLDAGAIRLWLVAPQVISPGTAMPAFYAIGQRDDPADPRFGEPLLTAAEVEDLVAYLSRQTGTRAESP